MENYFNEIYDKTYSKVLKYVIAKCDNLSNIQDIMQNIYLNLYNTILRKNEYIKNEEAFIYSLAKREIFKYYSLKNKFLSVFNNIEFDSLENNLIEDNMIDINLINKENFNIIWEYLKKEDLETQKIISLYYMEEIGIKNISILLKLNENTVKTKIYRTISKIRKVIGDENDV